MTTSFEKRALYPLDEVQATGSALDALRKGGFKKRFITATVGLAQSHKAEWQLSAEEMLYQSGLFLPVGYNFIGEERFFQEVVMKYLFDGTVDFSKVAILATSGGTDALSKIIGVLDGPIVPVGMPNWPNTAGIIEGKGGVVFPYLDFDIEAGVFQHENVIRVVQNLDGLSADSTNDEMSLFYDSQGSAFRKSTGVNLSGENDFVPTWIQEKMVTPLLHAVCKNPTGVDIPEEVDGYAVWGAVAEKALANDIILIVDAAYLEFGNGPEEDNKMIKYFASKGVKMMIAFSGSKLYNQYSNSRIGAIVAVNFPDNDDVKKKLLYEGRNTTSAIGTSAQLFAAVVEQFYHDQHKEWLKERRANGTANRKIIASQIKDNNLKTSILNGKGLFAAFSLKMAKWVFPELSMEMGVKVPKEAIEFPADNVRVAGIITPNSRLDDGNLRINMVQITSEQAQVIAKTLAYAEKRSNEK